MGGLVNTSTSKSNPSMATKGSVVLRRESRILRKPLSRKMSQTAKPPPIDRFFSSLKLFITDLYNLGVRLSDEGKITVARIKLNVFYNYFTDQSKKKEFIIEFINNSHKHWESISKREESFISTNLIHSMFPKVESSDVSSIMPLMNDENMKADKENAWVKITALARISIFYIYLERQPVVLGGENYKNGTFMSHIKIPDMAALFKMNLSDAY